MALRGANISANFDDVVHVNQSGAGLADHAGAEAALYVDDGAGGVDQICGRTAVRHWLDPDPDAISGSYEFSTMGDMDQTALETAGWTFENCTGAVTGGLLVLTASGASNPRRAYRTVSLSGDFFYTYSTALPMSGPCPDYSYGGIMVGANGGEGHSHSIATVGIDSRTHLYYGGTWASLSGTSNAGSCEFGPLVGALARFSGTLSAGVGPANMCFYNAAIPAATAGWQPNANTNTATTLDRLGFIMGQDGAATAGEKMAFRFLRRYV